MADTTTSRAARAGTLITSHRYNFVCTERAVELTNILLKRASSSQSHVLDSSHADLAKSLSKALSTYASEHYSLYATTACPYENEIAILIVANKYSPTNFWNGRWRSTYIYDPHSSSLTGKIRVNVHYNEDG